MYRVRQHLMPLTDIEGSEDSDEESLLEGHNHSFQVRGGVSLSSMFLEVLDRLISLLAWLCVCVFCLRFTPRTCRTLQIDQCWLSLKTRTIDLKRTFSDCSHFIFVYDFGIF